MFNKKPKKQNTSNLDLKIRIGKSKAPQQVKKRKSSQIKNFLKSKKSAQKNKRLNSIKRSKSARNVAIFFTLTTITLGLVFLLYKAVFWIIELRSSDDGNSKITYVAGFDDFPSYPNSEYIFMNTNESPTISQFISTGRAIYRLNRNESINDVFTYYKEFLKDTDWELIYSVPRNSHEMMYGEYYFNEKHGYGVRIYDRVNDIWYEKLTKDETLTGKSESVDQKQERDLILSSDEGTSLLPDFSWSMTVPKEYLVSYFATDFDRLRGVIFTEIKTGKQTILEPITKLSSIADDYYVEDYIKSLNIKDKKEDPQAPNWEIVNTKYTDIAGVYLLEALVSNGKKTSNVYIIHNNKDKFAYAIFSKDIDNTFLAYMLKNISESKTEYSGDEYILGDE